VNAVLQCLLNLYIFRKELLNYNKFDVLNLFAHRYEHGMNNLNIYEIRQSLGEYLISLRATWSLVFVHESVEIYIIHICIV